MKTAKARAIVFDLACPYCDSGGLQSPEGLGSLSWGAFEQAPPTAVCCDCGQTAKVPKKFPGGQIEIKKEEK